MCAPTFRDRIDLINKEVFASPEEAAEAFRGVADCFQVPFTADGIEPGTKSPSLAEMAKGELLDDEVCRRMEHFFLQLYYRRLRRNHAKGN